MGPFTAFRIHDREDRIEAGLETLTLDDLSDGDVVIRGEWSSINYKDALAATGAGKILRRYPLIGGVDIAGTVAESADPRLTEGQRVVVCGCGLSETRDGGFTQVARVPAESVTPLPNGLDTRTAMQLGTAGFTAALAVHRMEHNGQSPQLGPVVVTGSTGGVGSIAVNILSARGYEVAAMTSKPDADDYLRALGAAQILNLREMELGQRPLERATWGGAVDNLGGEPLAWLTRTVRPNGNIASIGLAAGTALNTTVMPFILRGVNLLGINSVDVDREQRIAVWERLAGDLQPPELDRIADREVTLDTLMPCFQDYVDGNVIGRTVVRLT